MATGAVCRLSLRTRRSAWRRAGTSWQGVMVTESVLGLGIVGLGFMGRRYAQFLHEIEGVRLAGVYDVDGELAGAIVAECGGTVYPNVDSLAAAADVAGVIVCTPEDRHLEAALATLERGKPLMVEK